MSRKGPLEAPVEDFLRPRHEAFRAAFPLEGKGNGNAVGIEQAVPARRVGRHDARRCE